MRSRKLIIRLVAGIAVLGIVLGGATIGASGNNPAVAQAAKKKVKLTRKQKLARALKACKKKPKAKRKSCEKSAKKLYGPNPGRTKHHKPPPPKKMHKEKEPETETTTTGTGTGGTATTGTTPPATTGTTPPATTGTTPPATTGTTPPATTGTTPPATTGTTPTEKPTAAEVTEGKALFAKENCSTCHGAAGEGAAGDDNKPYTALPRAKSIQGVVEQLTKPETPDGGFMPEYSKLSTAEKEAIGAYITVEFTKTETAH